VNEWQPPAGHPISVEKAKELLAGDLPDVYRDILKHCCIPIYWFRRDTENHEILHNGTLTLVKTPKRLLGITAAHVLRAYKGDIDRERVRLQLVDRVVDDLLERVIDVSDRLDLATVALDEKLLNSLGRPVTPLGVWPPRPPQEGRGIMLAGYPAIERLQPRSFEVNFGLFTVLGIARTVSNTQITWLVEREHSLEITKRGTLPSNYNLGGISGGPLISWFESQSYVTHYCLSGIVTEHPDYEKSDFAVERLVATRADLIGDSGTIHGFGAS
jgi:hypothetical protein